MDVLLTHGYFLQEDETEKRIMKPYPPLGILYISSYLKSKGFDVAIYDSTFKTKSDFFHYVETVKPSIVGLYVNLMTKLNVLDEIKFLKKLGSKVVVGGPDVPEYAENYVEFGADVAVIGEGEHTLEELIPALIANTSLDFVAGIVYRNQDGKMVRTPSRPLIPELDSLPFPDRDSIDIQQYLSTWKTHHGMGSISLICARGCPFTCTWCSRSIFGETHRRRSVKNVVDEIELLRERYKPEMLWFADDVFTINHKWFYEFFAEMKRRNIKMPFECISRADRLNDDILRKMKELGSFRIWYGSESGSQKILDAMQRRVSVEEIRRVTALAKKYGIQTGLFVMLGYTEEEISDIEETVEHLKQTQADTFLTTVAYPIKGTEFYHEVKNDIIDSRSWQNVTDRNLRFRRKYSDRFYWFAHRYLVNEVRQYTMRTNGNENFIQWASSYAKAKIARLGMTLTQ